MLVCSCIDLPKPVTLIGNSMIAVLSECVATFIYDRRVGLVADAVQSVIWQVSTATGDYIMTFDDPTIKPTYEVLPRVNRKHIRNSELYFTNLATNSVGKATILPDGSVACTIQILTTKPLTADDFALSDDATAYAGNNTLWQVTAGGHTAAFVGDPNSTVPQGITSLRLGGTVVDKDVLYLSTQGGLLEAPSGLEVHGGQLLAVNVKAFESHGKKD